MKVLLFYKTILILYSGYQYYSSIMLVQQLYLKTKMIASWVYFVVEKPFKLLKKDDTNEWIII